MVEKTKKKRTEVPGRTNNAEDREDREDKEDRPRGVLETVDLSKGQPKRKEESSPDKFQVDQV